MLARKISAALAVGALGLGVAATPVMGWDNEPPGTQKCNSGRGNGSEGCDPGNSSTSPGGDTGQNQGGDEGGPIHGGTGAP